VITDQQVTQAAGVAGLGSPNPFTISDLSHVWILCDVFENDLKNVRVGQFADVRLNAYPDRTFPARISNIGPILDPTIRTAKVRLEVENTGGLMRLGMFVTATFHGSEKQVHAIVPSTAILHLHDRDWVYLPGGGKSFRRAEVIGGITLPDNTQEVSGINPGDMVVKDALVLENSVEQ
jgi:cobalt-zinc-cadmium efflux system membrane fusion protein